MPRDIPYGQHWRRFEFEWSASGTQTFTHNYNVPNKLGNRASRINIHLGDAYVSAMTANDFTIVATTATGAGAFEAAVTDAFA